MAWKYGQKGRFAIVSGRTFAEVDMPESAPLIFPGLEKETDIEELKKSVLGRKVRSSWRITTTEGHKPYT
jgi:hypothetical protein